MTKTAIHHDKCSIVYGPNTIDYILIYCERKTMEIAVHPDGAVFVKAPVDSDITLIEKKLNKRARWILSQQRYFKQFEPKRPVRYYVNGETHLYLGRQYRLKMINGPQNSVKLIRGFFLMTFRDAPSSEIAKKLLDEWYMAKARVQFTMSMDRCWQKFASIDLYKPDFAIKRMKKRWGSLSAKKRVILNIDLIKAPRECIDYVLIHELCHFKHHDHSPGFYKLLDSLMPGWEKRKHKLEMSLNR